MRKRNKCTECEAYNTERVHTEWYSDMVEEVRICNECPTQFTNKYKIFERETDMVEA